MFVYCEQSTLKLKSMRLPIVNNKIKKQDKYFKNLYTVYLQNIILLLSRLDPLYQNEAHQVIGR